MKKNVVFIVAALFLAVLVPWYAEAANNCTTVAVSFSAEVPASWDGTVLLNYRLADGTGPAYVLSLNRSNNYTLKQTILEGKYHCTKAEAKGCEVSVKNTVLLKKGTEVKAVVRPDNAMDNLVDMSTETVEFIPSAGNNYWMAAIGVLVAAFLVVAVVLIKFVR